MDRGSDDFQSYSELFRVKAAAQDFDDLQDAISGRDVGRQRKHIRNNDRDPITNKKRKDGSDAVQRTLDWLLLNDPDYARLHNDAMDRLRDAEARTERILNQATTALNETREEIEDSLARAAKLPDGTAVFRDDQGRVRYEDGSFVDDELAALVVWTGQEPGYEEHSALLDRESELESVIDQLRDYQTDVLGTARDRLMDNANPLSPDQLEDVIEGTDWNVPDRLAEAIETPSFEVTSPMLGAVPEMPPRTGR